MYDAGNPKPVLCDNLEGGVMGWEMGGRFKMEGTYLYLMSIHAGVWQKLSKYAKQLSSNLKKKKKIR